MTEFRDMRQDARLEALERRVAAILEHLGIEDPAPATPLGVSTHVAELACSGRTIEAIKAHMDATGADLRTARDAVAAVNPMARATLGAGTPARSRRGSTADDAQAQPPAPPNPQAVRRASAQ